MKIKEIELKRGCYQSGTLANTLEYFLCLREAEIESYPCMGHSVQFV